MCRIPAALSGGLAGFSLQAHPQRNTSPRRLPRGVLMMTTRCNSFLPLAFHPNISSYGRLWLLQFAPFGNLNLAPGTGLSVTGTDWPGPPQIGQIFQVTWRGQTLAALGSSASVLGLASARGPSNKGDTQLAVGIRTYASRGLKCRRAGPMHMARQPGLCKSSTLFLTMYVT